MALRQVLLIDSRDRQVLGCKHPCRTSPTPAAKQSARAQNGYRNAYANQLQIAYLWQQPSLPIYST